MKVCRVQKMNFFVTFVIHCKQLKITRPEKYN